MNLTKQEKFQRNLCKKSFLEEKQFVKEKISQTKEEVDES